MASLDSHVAGDSTVGLHADLVPPEIPLKSDKLKTGRRATDQMGAKPAIAFRAVRQDARAVQDSVAGYEQVVLQRVGSGDV